MLISIQPILCVIILFLFFQVVVYRSFYLHWNINLVENYLAYLLGRPNKEKKLFY